MRTLNVHMLMFMFMFMFMSMFMFMFMCHVTCMYALACVNLYHKRSSRINLHDFNANMLSLRYLNDPRGSSKLRCHHFL